jgi:DNA-binding response OmpR family regulator
VRHLTEPPAASEASGHASPRSARILIVDDDPDIVRLLMMTLDPDGFQLSSAADGQSALAMARAERPDLVLLDWNMPGMSGLDVCRALRAESDPRLRDVPVVMLTAQVNAEDTAAGFAAGVTDYVTKPFKPAYIVARVHAWLLRGRSRGG